jgi:hypothetical protein
MLAVGRQRDLMQNLEGQGPINETPEATGIARASGSPVAGLAGSTDSESTAVPQGKPLNPIKAIRAKCLDCCGGSSTEVKLCGAFECALYPFRFGKNPFRVKVHVSEELKAKRVAGLAKAREARNG